MTSRFTSWDDYRIFTRDIQRSRYIHSPRVARFLEAVRETAKDRVLPVEKGWLFWRAQSGYRGKKVLRPYSATRMKPQPDKAVEGRVNPKGTPCLYGAGKPEAAIAEIRPWIGEIISLAVLKVQRDLRLIECLKYRDATGFSTLLNRRVVEGKFTKGSSSDIEKDVWTYIDRAFSKPISKTDDKADYVPTQVIAELLRSSGYDGIFYWSRLSEIGVNVAFFDPKVAEVTATRVLYEVTSVSIASRQYEAER